MLLPVSDINIKVKILRRWSSVHHCKSVNTKSFGGVSDKEQIIQLQSSWKMVNKRGIGATKGTD